MEGNNNSTAAKQSSMASIESALRRSTLLDMQKQGEELPLTASSGGSETRATTTSFITIMVGAGVLGFPALFSKVGVPLGAFMLTSCTLMSVYLCKTVGDTCTRVQERTGKPVSKMDDLGQACFGYLGEVISRIVVNGMFIGMVSCYMVLIGQNLAFLLPLPYRAWILIFTLLLMPAAFMRDISILEKLAIVGVVASCVYFITITGGGIMAGNKTGSFEAAPSVKPFSIFSVFTIMMFGYGPTHVLPSVRREMKNPQELPQALVVSHLIVGVIYMSAGIIGYWGFGALTQGNISMSMCESPGCPGTVPACATPPCPELTSEKAGSKWAFGYFLAVAVVANLCVTIPIVLYCCFTGIEASYSKDKPMDATKSAVMRVGVVLFCTSVGLFVPFFLQVVSILSAALVVPIVFFLPLAFGWKSAKDSGVPYDTPRIVFDSFLLLVGVACFVIGLYSSIDDLMQAMERDAAAANPFANFFK